MNTNKDNNILQAIRVCAADAGVVIVFATFKGEILSCFNHTDKGLFEKEYAKALEYAYENKCFVYGALLFPDEFPFKVRGSQEDNFLAVFKLSSNGGATSSLPQYVLNTKPYTRLMNAIKTISLIQ